ncbi:MAG: hypothetical protein ACI9VX_002373, partial [Dinoroseobacter sp.]
LAKTSKRTVSFESDSKEKPSLDLYNLTASRRLRGARNRLVF